MILVDRALETREAEGNPIRVGLVGAGYMGRGIVQQFLTPLIGMRLVAIGNRTLSSAERAYRDAGVDTVRFVETAGQLEEAARLNRYAITDNPTLLADSENVDAIIEATGDLEFGACIVLRAISKSKHVILVNAELDATIGPILKLYADKAGVIITNTDGDEPGVAMNLVRLMKTMGHRPVLAGNLKGMLDRYRTPATQREFATRHGQKPRLITSFADGTKLSMELTVLANATDFRVGKRGMYGHRCAHIKDILNHFTADMFEKGGLVDYVLVTEPNNGAFVVVHEEHPIKQQYMKYFKMGDGPLYVYYTPFHLPHLQVASTVARAVLFHDATVAPLGPPACDVLTAAKRDLRKGETLDGIGGFTCYGVIDNADTCRRDSFLPMGLSQDCVLKTDIPKDEIISSADVDRPAGRLSDRLRHEQDVHYSTR